MDEIDGLGDVVGGAVLAVAVEPATGSVGGDGHTQERSCLNCGAALVGDYCHACGQRGHVHRSLGAFVHDLLHGVLHFEGKVWRTLPMLAWCPGDLTRRYIEGQRARYVSPIALFLFSVFLMFAVVSATGNLNPSIGAAQDLAKAEAEATRELATLRKKQQAAVSAKASTVELDTQIRDQQAAIQVIRAMRSRGLTEAILTEPDPDFHSSAPWIEAAYHKARQNPQLLLYKLRTNAYKWSWALIPLSVPLMWLLFPFSRRFRLYDHIVFVTYSLSFMMLLVIVATSLAYFGIAAVAPILLFIPPIHMYRQLRGTYSLGRFGALWRTAALALSAIVVLTLYVLLMVAVGAFA